MKSTSTDKIWRERPDIIRGYLDNLPKFERLCEEIEYILNSKLAEANVETAHVVSRVKDLSSYCEKIDRKSYLDPLSDITDLAGVRVVFLYLSDLPKIEKIVEDEFEVVEKENKLQNKSAENFGYGALHYLVRIKKLHSGPRYDDLRSFVCEIQVRTILQDAWSIVAHHLSYKHETDVPKSLVRRLNALSGLFETADDQFENLRLARSLYIESMGKNILSDNDILKQEMNLDALIAYGASKFPMRKNSSPEEFAELLDELKIAGYGTLYDLDLAVQKGLNAAIIDEKDYPPWGIDDNELTEYNSVGIIRNSVAMVDGDYCLDKYGKDLFERHKKYNLMG